MTIADYYDEISRCNRCGFCQVACPVFRSTGHESGVARGRLALLRALIEERLDWVEAVKEPLFNCLLCGACTANCFSAVPTADLMAKARTEYLEKVGRKPIHRLLFDHLLPYPNRLRTAARMAALGKNTGLSKVGQALGLLKIFGRDFPRAQEIVQRLPLKALRDRIKPGILSGQGKTLNIGYFVGCGVDIVQQEAGRATLRYLRKIARTVSVLDNCCCGLPASSYGDLPAARKLAERNLHLPTLDKFDFMVTDCASCASFLKRYPDLFPENDPRRESAVTFSSRIKDLTELIACSKAPVSSSTPPSIVTYHDPCHASRGQDIVAEPREILGNLPGIEYVELPEADWCCGGAGSYALGHYDLSRQVLDRKIANVRKTKADTLVTSCPACLIHLSYGIRKQGLKIQVRHLSEII